MSAQIVILAEWRERKVSAQYTFDPIASWMAWVGFWMGKR